MHGQNGHFRDTEARCAGLSWSVTELQSQGVYHHAGQISIRVTEQGSAGPSWLSQRIAYMLYRGRNATCNLHIRGGGRLLDVTLVIKDIVIF